jgi:bleomycin hydrolase
MNWLITNRLREATCIFKRKYVELSKNGQSKDDIIKLLRVDKEEVLREIFNILCCELGVPPTTFDWTYKGTEASKQHISDTIDDAQTTTDSPSTLSSSSSSSSSSKGSKASKTTQFIKEKFLTPVSFFKSNFSSLNTNISLVNDPRNKYFQTYTVDYLGNVVGGKKVLYVNVPIDTLKLITVHVLKNKKLPVWFGCDSGKFGHREMGLWDDNQFDYEGAFGSKFRLSKAERLTYGESLMTHAMIFTGVDVESVQSASASSESKNGDVDAASSAATSDTDKLKIIKFRVENSWGNKNGDQGYYCITNSWFDEFVYQIVVNLDHIPVEHDLRKQVSDALLLEPIVLPAWDPMGALA